MFRTIAVIGCSGAIGQALVNHFAQRYPQATIHAFSRQACQFAAANVLAHQLVDYSDASLAAAAQQASAQQPLECVVVTTGILHAGDIQPEKSMRDLSAEKFTQLFAVNTIIPALAAKHFLPKLANKRRVVFAALSARVGSISDNRLGGWYAYRASKAALNMVIKNLAIEVGRRYPQAVVVGLHPGTVDSHLSKPFQNHVPEGKLFTAAYAAERLSDVIAELSPTMTGKCFAWDNKEVLP